MQYCSNLPYLKAVGFFGIRTALPRLPPWQRKEKRRHGSMELLRCSPLQEYHHVSFNTFHIGPVSRCVAQCWALRDSVGPTKKTGSLDTNSTAHHHHPSHIHTQRTALIIPQTRLSFYKSALPLYFSCLKAYNGCFKFASPPEHYIRRCSRDVSHPSYLDKVTLKEERLGCLIQHNA